MSVNTLVKGEHPLLNTSGLQKSESDLHMTSLHKKMLDTIQAMQKRVGDSEYSAMNFTQIGDYKMSKHLGAGSYASVR